LPGPTQPLNKLKELLFAFTGLLIKIREIKMSLVSSDILSGSLMSLIDIALINGFCYECSTLAIIGITGGSFQNNLGEKLIFEGNQGCPYS
jgi:hypothetical protein